MRMNTFAVALSVCVISLVLAKALTEHTDLVRGSSSVLSVSRHVTDCFWQDEQRIDTAQEGYAQIKELLRKDRIKNDEGKVIHVTLGPSLHRVLCGEP